MWVLLQRLEKWLYWVNILSHMSHWYGYKSKWIWACLTLIVWDVLNFALSSIYSFTFHVWETNLYLLDCIFTKFCYAFRCLWHQVAFTSRSARATSSLFVSSWSLLISIVVSLVDVGHYIYIFFTSSFPSTSYFAMCPQYLPLLSLLLKFLVIRLICYFFFHNNLFILRFCFWFICTFSLALNVKLIVHLYQLYFVFFAVLLFHMVIESVSSTCCGLAFLTM